MNLSRESILNEFIRLYQLYHGTSIEVFKGEEYTVIVYFKIDPSDEENMEIVDYKTYKNTVVVKLRRKRVKKRSRQNTLTECIENQ
jgi:hypothetical protein